MLEAFQKRQQNQIQAQFLGNPNRRTYSAGHFSDSIANAFKVVEIEIRKAASLPDSDYGNDLIKKAFSESSVGATAPASWE
jgi:hypothetical protein